MDTNSDLFSAYLGLGTSYVGSPPATIDPTQPFNDTRLTLQPPNNPSFRSTNSGTVAQPFTIGPITLSPYDQPRDAVMPSSASVQSPYAMYVAMALLALVSIALLNAVIGVE